MSISSIESHAPTQRLNLKGGFETASKVSAAIPGESGKYPPRSLRAAMARQVLVGMGRKGYTPVQPGTALKSIRTRFDVCRG